VALFFIEMITLASFTFLCRVCHFLEATNEKAVGR
jgi:hypothetical protein